MSLALILAVLLDHWLGEPQKHHPLVLFGNTANCVENKLLNVNGTAIRQKISGVIALLLMVFPLVALFFWLSQWKVVDNFLSPLILYFCIAANSLKQHAINVLDALEAKNVALAKQQVAMLVSRQTKNMQIADIRKATIESVLENGADAVFSPIFWFVVAGPAGVVMYRLSNTLDAMWGYKDERYTHFGWAAARFDDVLNWVPARLSAVTYALLGKSTLAIHCWKNQAHLLDSPNAGPVMASGAGALNIQLGGPAYYHGKLKQKIYFGTTRQAENKDIKRSIQLVNGSLFLWVFILVLGDNFA